MTPFSSTPLAGSFTGSPLLASPTALGSSSSLAVQPVSLGVSCSVLPVTGPSPSVSPSPSPTPVPIGSATELAVSCSAPAPAVIDFGQYAGLTSPLLVAVLLLAVLVGRAVHRR